MKKHDLKDVSKDLKKIKEARKTKPIENYRIVLVNFAQYEAKPYGYKPKTIKYFYAIDDADANRKLHTEVIVLPKVDNSAYFWKYANTTIGSDGKYYDDILDDIEAYKANRSIWQAISTWWHVHVTSRLSDIKYWFADLFYWLKTKHNRKESWEIFSSMMGILEHNIPLLIKNHVGVPNRYCVEARKQMHANEKNFDIDASFKKNPNSDDKELEFASKLYVEDLEKLLLNVRLLNYYDGFGIIDEKNPTEVELKKQYKIPYKKGSWKEIDYEKLQKLQDICNNAIFNQLKDMGRCLWD